MLDAFDYYLLSSILVIFLVPNLKQASEKEAMERLRRDLIGKSRLIGSFSSKLEVSPTLQSIKIQRVVRFALGNRGGLDQPLKYELAKKIELFILKFAAFMQRSEKSKKLLKYLFVGVKLVLSLVLSMHKIQLEYIMLCE